MKRARAAHTGFVHSLRIQVKSAIRVFLQEVLDDLRNASFFSEHVDKQALARALFQDALVIVYRLLVLLKLEATKEQARFSDGISLSDEFAPIVRKVLDSPEKTEENLGLRLGARFRAFRAGFPVGAGLFAEGTTSILEEPHIHWSDRASARLLDALLWTTKTPKKERQRVAYDLLRVEDFGRVYEALLGYEPGLATEPMCLLRRQKLEVVVPEARGETYRKNVAKQAGARQRSSEKTRIIWIENIPVGTFYLRLGLGRKASGSYYTPQPFVRFLIRETLESQVAERCPVDNPNPVAILSLSVLDPAMGAGLFLVEACRYLGDELYAACRLCSKWANEAEEAAKHATGMERDKRLQVAWSWRQRLWDLPAPQNEMLVHSLHKWQNADVLRAQALCRNLVAAHCLYGVDKNPWVVELAKLSLWLESYAEGAPWPSLEKRLVAGDSLSGPMFADLGTSPSGRKNKRIADLHAQPRLGRAFLHLREETSTTNETGLARPSFDKGLEPLLMLAAAWSGGVMLGESAVDAEYEALMHVIANDGNIESFVSERPLLQRMIAAGRSGISFDLRFPEVFYPNGEIGPSSGFRAVVGNPPWEAVQPLAKEFYAAFDLRILDAPTRLERALVEQQLNADPEVRRAFTDYVTQAEATKRLMNRCFRYVNRRTDGTASSAVMDLWQAFAERSRHLLAPNGQLGMLLPSAFHSNQSATGIRELLLRESQLVACYSYENREKIFDIDSRFKFALVVARARKPDPSDTVQCAFYLHDVKWLETKTSLEYSLEFIEKTGGEFITLLELKTRMDVEIVDHCFSGALLFGAAREKCGINLGRELHMTDDAWRFVSPATIGAMHDLREPRLALELRQRGYIPLYEGKTFHQYTDRWDERPRYLLAIERLGDKKAWLRAARYFRLAVRSIANATNERTAIFALLPPGVLLGNSALSEREPWVRPYANALLLLACANTLSFDWNLRQKASANVNRFILDGCPIPPALFDLPRSTFLAHGALRLSCHHEGYASLWKEQLGANTWRESKPKETWPVLDGDDERWTIRAAIDAVVADAYGLSRTQYAHLLSSFRHKSYPRAHELCLTAFDELQKIGLVSFVRVHDPYWDVPLVEDLPSSAIEWSSETTHLEVVPAHWNVTTSPR